MKLLPWSCLGLSRLARVPMSWPGQLLPEIYFSFGPPLLFYDSMFFSSLLFLPCPLLFTLAYVHYKYSHIHIHTHIFFLFPSLPFFFLDLEIS